MGTDDAHSLEVSGPANLDRQALYFCADESLIDDAMDMPQSGGGKRAAAEQGGERTVPTSKIPGREDPQYQRVLQLMQRKPPTFEEARDAAVYLKAFTACEQGELARARQEGKPADLPRITALASDLHVLGDAFARLGEHSRTADSFGILAGEPEDGHPRNYLQRAYDAYHQCLDLRRRSNQALGETDVQLREKLAVLHVRANLPNEERLQAHAATLACQEAAYAKDSPKLIPTLRAMERLEKPGEAYAHEKRILDIQLQALGEGKLRRDVVFRDGTHERLAVLARAVGDWPVARRYDLDVENDCLAAARTLGLHTYPSEKPGQATTKPQTNQERSELYQRCCDIADDAKLVARTLGDDSPLYARLETSLGDHHKAMEDYQSALAAYTASNRAINQHNSRIGLPDALSPSLIAVRSGIAESLAGMASARPQHEQAEAFATARAEMQRAVAMAALQSRPAPGDGAGGDQVKPLLSLLDRLSEIYHREGYDPTLGGVKSCGDVLDTLQGLKLPLHDQLCAKMYHNIDAFSTKFPELSNRVAAMFELGFLYKKMLGVQDQQYGDKADPRLLPTLSRLRDICSPYLVENSLQFRADAQAAVAMRTEAVERILAIDEKRFGADDERLLPSLEECARTYFLGKDERKSLAVRERMVSIVEPKFGSEDPRLLEPLKGLAEQSARLGNWDAAFAARQKVVTIESTKHGPDSAQTHAALDDLAATYSRAGHRDQALAIHEQILASEQGSLGAGDYRVRRRHLLIGDEFGRDGKPAEAEKHYRLWLGLSAQALPDIKATSATSNDFDFCLRRHFREAGLSDELQEYGTRAEMLTALYEHQQNMPPLSSSSRGNLVLYRHDKILQSERGSGRQLTPERYRQAIAERFNKLAEMARVNGRPADAEAHREDARRVAQLPERSLGPGRKD